MLVWELNRHFPPLNPSNGCLFTFRRKIKLRADTVFSMLRLSRKLLHPACSIIWYYIILSAINVVSDSRDAIKYQFVMASLGEHTDVLMHRKLEKFVEHFKRYSESSVAQNCMLFVRTLCIGKRKSHADLWLLSMGVIEEPLLWITNQCLLCTNICTNKQCRFMLNYSDMFRC